MDSPALGQGAPAPSLRSSPRVLIAQYICLIAQSSAHRTIYLPHRTEFCLIAQYICLIAQSLPRAGQLPHRSEFAHSFSPHRSEYLCMYVLCMEPRTTFSMCTCVPVDKLHYYRYTVESCSPDRPPDFVAGLLTVLGSEDRCEERANIQRISTSFQNFGGSGEP